MKQIPVTPPPMGWSSWNSYAQTIDSEIIVRQAKALVASGLQEVGYRYVNIDEGWWQGERDKTGDIVVDPERWPALASGEQAGNMNNIVKLIHSLGLKAGIYTDAGESGCGYWWPDLEPAQPHTGSEGYYDTDFLQFAKWGFDFVKVDWCGGDKENEDPAVQYAAISRAITHAEAITGRRLFYSICDWGNNSPWTWAPGIGGVTGDMWRTSLDIVDPIVAGTKFADRRASFLAVLSNFGRAIHPEAQHTGYYNDPDMMVVGMKGMSEEQNRINMSLWAISGAPLIVGADLTKLNRATLATLANRDVIAVDQDILGLQGVRVAETEPGLQVWAKRLSGSGRRAVLLLNRTARAAPITVRWIELGLVPSSVARVRDLWAQKTLGPFTTSYTATVPADDIVLLTVEGSESPGTWYEAGSPTNRFAGGAATASCQNCSEGKGVTLGSGREVTFNNVTATATLNFLQIVYINRGKESRIVELSANGEPPTKITFPPTGRDTSLGAIIIGVDLEPFADNRLKFSAPGAAGLTLDSVSVLRGPEANPPSTLASNIVLLTVQGKEGTGTKYKASSPINSFAGGAAPVSCQNCSDGEGVTLGSGREMTFNNVAATATLNFLQIAYINGSNEPRMVELSVNGEPSTEIAFPPTGADEPIMTIIIEVNLKPCGDNRLMFSAPGAAGLTLDSISVLRGPV